MRNKKMLIFLICFILILGAGCGTKEKVDPRISEISELTVVHKYNEAREKAKELFVDDEDKLNQVLRNIDKLEGIQNDYEESNPDFYKNNIEVSDVKKLEIQSNHTGKIKDGYIYITGRVKNISDTDIEYFEVVCKFLDKDGQVLDSDYTNDGLMLKPGEMREFEIMHKYKSEYDSYSLSIGDIK